MRLGELTLEQAATEAASNWRKFGSFAWHDKPDHAEKWAIVYTHNRDSGLIDKVNAAFTLLWCRYGMAPASTIP